MKFQYDILIGKEDPSSHGVNWRLASNMSNVLGIDLLKILNALGTQGWEVASTGQIYFTPASEIILKRQVG